MRCGQIKTSLYSAVQSVLSILQRSKLSNSYMNKILLSIKRRMKQQLLGISTDE